MEGSFVWVLKCLISLDDARLVWHSMAGRVAAATRLRDAILEVNIDAIKAVRKDVELERKV